MAGNLEEVIETVDIVLSVVPSTEAPAVAEQVVFAAHRVDRRPLVADLNAVAPGTLSRLGATFAAAGIPFVDGAISGPPPTVRPGAKVYIATISHHLPGPRGRERAMYEKLT